MDVVNKNLITKGLQEKIKLSEEFLEPIPKSEHKYCHLCKAIFNDYKFHVNSDKHFDNFHKHINIWRRIKNTFERIIDFWDIKEGRPLRPRIRTITPEKNIIKNEISPNTNLNINKKINIKDEDISTKEGSSQENNNIKFSYVNTDPKNISNKIQQSINKNNIKKTISINNENQNNNLNIKTIISSNIKIDQNIKQKNIKEKNINTIPVTEDKEIAVLKESKENNIIPKSTNGNIVKNIRIKTEKPLFKTNNSGNSSLFKTEVMINKNKINNNIKRKRKRNENTFFVISTESSLKLPNNQKQSINGFFNNLKADNPNNLIGNRNVFFK